MNTKALPAFRSITVLAVLFGLVLLCSIWTGLYYKVQDERQLELDNSFKELAGYVRAFEEHIVRTIKGLDQVAMFLKYKAEKDGLAVDIPSLVAEKRFEGQPFIILGVVNEKGDFISSNQVPFEKLNIKDREHFLAHQKADSGQLFIGKPIVGRASDKMSIQLTRRINKPDGSFGGVVGISVDPFYFAEFYKQVNLGMNSSVVLVGRDNIVRVRQSDAEIAIGQDFNNSEVMKKVSVSDAGSFTATSLIDGINRIYSYRALKEYPLIVVAGLSETQVFQNLQQRVAGYYWVCGVISLAIVFFVAALLVAMQRRSHAAELLSESEAQFRSLAETSMDYIMRYDSQYRHTYMNPAALRVVGLTAADILGKTHRESGFSAEQSDFWEDAIRKVFLTAEPYQSVFEWISVDGPVILDWRLAPERGADGRVLSVLGISRDITEHFLAEKATKHNAEIQAVLREIAEAAVLTVSLDELYLTALRLLGRVLPAKFIKIALLDEAALEITVPCCVGDDKGIQRRRPLKKGLTEFILLRGKAVHITPEKFARLQECGEIDIEGMSINDWLGAPLLDSQGKAFGAIALNSLDTAQSFTPGDIEVLSIIAAQVSMSIERKWAETALRESEKQVRLLLNSTAEAIYGIDINDNCTFANRSCLTILGYTEPDQLLGKNMHDLIHHSYTDGSPMHIEDCKIFKAFREGAQAHGDDESFWKADGTTFPAEYWAYPQVANGKITGAVVTFTDITERKLTEKIIKTSRTRYQALMEQSSEALVVVDGETREVVEINRKFTELFGFSLPADAPMYAKHFMLDTRKDADIIFATLKQQRILPPEVRVFRHKNGRHIPVERTATVINLEGRDYNLVSLRDMTEERRRQAELSRDVEFARRVQKELLPELSDSLEVSIRTLYHPVNFVSGDSYHLEWHNDGKLLRGFLIDVSGHGLATAIQTASISVLLREAALAKLSLRGQLEYINSRAATYFTDGAYAAILGFELDLALSELHYVGAGITQFYANGVKVETAGMFVGMWKDADFFSGRFAISRGDCFHFLTDGFTDALVQPENAAFWSSDGKDFDADVKALERLAKNGRLRDDATGVCIRVKSLPDREG